jgi:O-acetyl-ADP-ribose deacetylase (regulator of RNase III)
MIKYIKGDVTNPQFDTELCVIVHGVNNSGISFGSGVAGAITRKWQHVRQDYLNWGSELYPDNLELGSGIFSKAEDNIYVYHLVSQDGLIGQDNPTPAKKWAILKGLEDFLNSNFPFDKTTIVSSKIGCGLGGLSWEDDVKPIYDLVFKDHTVYIYDIN